MNTVAKRNRPPANRGVWRFPIDVHPERCPVQTTLDVISGKWKPLIVYHLMDGPKRFGDLLRDVPAISHRMLTRQLRELEAKRLVTRTVFPEVPPRVEYELTELGRDLDAVFAAVAEWGVRFLASQPEAGDGR